MKKLNIKKPYDSALNATRFEVTDNGKWQGVYGPNIDFVFNNNEGEYEHDVCLNYQIQTSRKGEMYVAIQLKGIGKNCHNGGCEELLYFGKINGRNEPRRIWDQVMKCLEHEKEQNEPENLASTNLEKYSNILTT